MMENVNQVNTFLPGLLLVMTVTDSCNTATVRHQECGHYYSRVNV